MDKSKSTKADILAIFAVPLVIVVALWVATTA